MPKISLHDLDDGSLLKGPISLCSYPKSTKSRCLTRSTSPAPPEVNRLRFAENNLHRRGRGTAAFQRAAEHDLLPSNLSVHSHSCESLYSIVGRAMNQDTAHASSASDWTTPHPFLAPVLSTTSHCICLYSSSFLLCDSPSLIGTMYNK